MYVAYCKKHNLYILNFLIESPFSHSRQISVCVFEVNDENPLLLFSRKWVLVTFFAQVFQLNFT